MYSNIKMLLTCVTLLSTFLKLINIKLHKIYIFMQLEYILNKKQLLLFEKFICSSYYHKSAKIMNNS